MPPRSIRRTEIRRAQFESGETGTESPVAEGGGGGGMVRVGNVARAEL